MTTHIVTLAPNRYWGFRPDEDGDDVIDHWESNVVLVTPNGHRHKIGYVGPRGAARRVQGGEVLPGPYMFAYGLATCISSNPKMSTGYESQQLKEKGLEFTVDDGDVIVVPGAAFTVRILRRDWIELDLQG
jgi:hypothetical protein